jgi:putative ABC transport system permease protein
MGGILRVAYKLLINGRAKYAALLVGISFAVFLMIEMTSLFAGILTRSSATVINIGASIWVMDPAIQTVASKIPLPAYVLDEVRSIPGVKYSVPMFSGGAMLKLPDGVYQPANIIGLDDTSLCGRPMMAATSRTSTQKTRLSRSGTRSSTNSRARKWARNLNSTITAG